MGTSFVVYYVPKMKKSILTTNDSHWSSKTKTAYLIIQQERERRRWYLVSVRDTDHSRAHCKELDDVRAPAMAPFGDLRTNHPLCSQADCLGLHALHGQFTGIVESLRVVGHLHVLANLLEPLPHPLVGSVVAKIA